jgi:hypothetical protein
MPETLAELEEVRRRLYAQLTKVGDFRKGSLAASYRKCGKKNCACAKTSHPGHLRYMCYGSGKRYDAESESRNASTFLPRGCFRIATSP